MPGAVEQTLDNLLSNALRATPLGSTVTMDLRFPAPDRRRHPHGRPVRIDVHVVDEGPGMTEDQRRRAFDRFWRAPDAPKGGTGLGLSLVQRLAHASGGEATLAAAPGGGLDAGIRLRPAARSLASRPAGIGMRRAKPTGRPALAEDVTEESARTPA